MSRPIRSVNIAAQNPPTISVGMPVYNGSRWIRESIEAILAQTYTDFELVIADNQSSDGTYKICAQYAASDHRVHLHRNDQNIGPARNFNRVFELSRGRYFKWASANDLCADTLLERCVQVLEEQPDVVLCYPKTLMIDAAGETVSEYEDRLHIMDDNPYVRFRTYLEKVRLNNVEQALIRRSALQQTPLQEDILNTDTILMAEIALQGKFFEVQEFLFSRRMAKGASTKVQTDEQIARFFNAEDSELTGQTWKMLRAYASLIRRATVTTDDRFRLWILFSRMVRWSFSGLWQDLRQSLRLSLARKQPQ